MKRALLAVVVLAAAAGAAGWWWLHRAPDAAAWQGYVDAEYVRVSPTLTGRITSIAVARGDQVAAGRAAVHPGRCGRRRGARCRRRQAGGGRGAARQPGDPQPRHRDRPGARRPRRSGRHQGPHRQGPGAQRGAAAHRCRQPPDRGSAARRARLRPSRASRRPSAKLEQMQSPTGREYEIAAQRAMVAQARAGLAQAEWRVDQRHVVAPVAALVSDTYARPGETINAGVPVVSLLPPQNILVRFFVPETELATSHVGDRLAIGCDGCAAGLTATITFIAPQPEYTPPVIYSEIQPREAGLSDRGASAARAGRAAQAGPAGGRAAMTALAIDVHDLRKSFGPRRVIDGLTLQVPEGEICGFLGGNGSGKTTTIRMLCGLLRPDGGGGTCLGMDLLRDAPRIRLQIGYMTQRFSFYGDLTVAENLEFVARLYQIRDRRRVDRRGAGAHRPGRSRRSAGAGAVGRLEAAHGARRLRAAPAAPAAARRTDRRRRCQGAARVLGHDPRDGRRWHDRAGLHALHGRGGTLPARGVSRRRAAGGAGHARTRWCAPRIWSRSRRPATASSRRCAGCAASRAWRPRRCSAARCASPAWTARRCAPPSTASATAALHWQEVEPRLDDVFIHMLRDTEA